MDQTEEIKTMENRLLDALADMEETYTRRLDSMSKRITQLESKRHGFDADDPTRDIITMMVWVGVGRIVFEIALTMIENWREKSTAKVIEGK